ncbi:unnamed protein product, partial [Mesorhabditis spiculigera]
MARAPQKITNLDSEPRRHGTAVGPPPSYRHGSETGSDYSSVSQMGKRRASWTNLVESDDNLTAIRVNQYPNVTASQTSVATAPVGPHSYQPTVAGQPLVAPYGHYNVNPNLRTPSRLSHFGSQVFVMVATRRFRKEFSRQGSFSSFFAGALKCAPAPGMPTDNFGRYQIDVPLKLRTFPKGTLVDAAPPIPGERVPHHRTASTSQHSVANSDAILADGRNKRKRNRLQDCMNWCSRPKQGLCALFFVLLLVVGVIAAIVIPLALRPPKRVSLQLQAPQSARGASSATTSIQMNADGDQVRFNIRGSPPLKGNFLTVYDFKTNWVGIVDESLRTNGRQLFCFVMRLDRGNVIDEDELRKATQAARGKGQATQGWQETWGFQPTPLQIQNQTQYFSQPITECNGARWVQLDMTSGQSAQQCTDCQSFCVPELGIDRDAAKGENTLNVIRLDCFQLFVPEWRQYAQQNTMEQNQRDYEQYYRLPGGSGAQQGAEGKWINVYGQQRQQQRNGVIPGQVYPNGAMTAGTSISGNSNNHPNTRSGDGLLGPQSQFANRLQQNAQLTAEQEEQLRQYSKERNPGLPNGQLFPIGPTGMNGASSTGVILPPGAPRPIHTIAWHGGDPSQQWLNAQSASNPAMPPVGWSAQQSGQYGQENGNGISGSINRNVVQPALNTLQSGVQNAQQGLQNGVQSVGYSLQNGINNLQGNIQNLQGNSQDHNVPSPQQLLQQTRQRLANQYVNGNTQQQQSQQPGANFPHIGPQGGYQMYSSYGQPGQQNQNQVNTQQIPGGIINGNPQNLNVQPF